MNTLQTTLSALALAAGASAHGHVSNVVINGISYEGYNAPSWWGQNQAAPNVFAWAAGDTDNGFIAPDAFGSPDIICHKSAINAQSHVQVAAGDTLSIQWNTWPQVHNGPMLDYLAPCNGPCETVDKTTLEFFKIDQVGIVDGTKEPPIFGNNIMYNNNYTWRVQIPSFIAPGNYVLRHEPRALHSAGALDGAQAYPQCFNLLITGSGTQKPAGTLGTALYKENDPGILIDIYTTSIQYIMPGPTLIAGVPSSVSQVSSHIVASSSATPYGGSAPAGGSSGGSQPTSTAAASKPPSSTMVTTTAPAAGGATQSAYGQCGGSGYSGPTLCGSGLHCSVQNQYYAQCVT